MSEPVTPTAPRALRRTLLTQSWLDVSMVHWAADPERRAAADPGGHPAGPAGRHDVRRADRLPDAPAGLGPRPALPYLGDFLETNVRLYTVDGEGRRGVFFCTLDASRLLPVLGGRYAARVPYVWSRMRFRRVGDMVRLPLPPAVAGPAGDEPDAGAGRARLLRRRPSWSHFLTARWGLHTSWYGRTIYLPNVHEPWPLHRAELR